MHSEDYYERVKDIISREVFEKRVKELDTEFDGLLERDVLEYIVVDEMGRNRGFIIPISGLKAGMSCTVFGKVMEKLGGGRKSLIISDNTSSCLLTLWDYHAEIFDQIKEGSVLKIVNGFARVRGRWTEINAGKWSQIEIDPKDAPSINIKSITGRIVDTEDTKVAFDWQGNVIFSKRIWIDTGFMSIPVIVWNEHVKIIKRFGKGETITIHNPIRKVRNNELIEVEVRSSSKILPADESKSTI